ncbi:DUF1311 domain-containing protein [Xanthomonas nasturtii]|uniref:DUF1311 domain-containing protein n=1 Tax=Xanthomonas nasturtii TaxID=1843581 RepID=A0ABT0LPB2_9XANT|nr:lysozyme inhibitor LprI family protein [Xanthomonas nasturtii]MCL1500597.1 DUF1311 domain-containing protein [Xanthomonas nasturtii]MCL1504828.1 DUF1311 domain-containing protein [Xanthomonas nasturtii]MCL1524208.1 DUF1311 domain-containing protein [Xanthomonas nasturtii]MCL1526419.1 DUF1311 domain-containing protein [Xanthomonas nasturtii]MCL1530797.1 DUF1311 domain-containing protein [Xanthomonas nasturtii]
MKLLSSRSDKARLARHWRACLGATALFPSCGTLHAADLCVDLQTTAESNACWVKEVAIAQARLDDYLGVARERAVTTLGVAADAFDNAQTAWANYAALQCGNVRQRWGTASVAAAKAASCMVDLNDQRAHDLWKAYLTYVDRTPSIKPEPPQHAGKR